MRDKKDPDLERRFNYHAPKDDQQERYEQIRAAARAFAYLIVDLTPFCPEQTRAIDKLDEVVMLANAAIARNE